MTCDSGARPVGRAGYGVDPAGGGSPRGRRGRGGDPARATDPGGSLRRGKSETSTYFLATAPGQQCYSAIYHDNPTPPPAQPPRPLPPLHPAAPAPLVASRRARPRGGGAGGNCLDSPRRGRYKRSGPGGVGTMTRYQLAKLIEWAGTLRTRKKMQKVVFLLQAAGCPYGADFGLHHYGPYSQDLARLADEMVRQGLLREGSTGQEYHYTLSEDARAKLAEFESGSEGATAVGGVAPFAECARRLLAVEVKELEVAATVAFFRRQGHEWPAALEKTRLFKS